MKEIINKKSHYIEQDSSGWELAAICCAVGGWAVGTAIVASVSSETTDLSPLQMLLLGAIPVQITGTVGVIVVLSHYAPFRAWAPMLQLSIPRRIRHLAVHTGKYLLLAVPITLLLTGVTHILFDSLGVSSSPAPVLRMLQETGSATFWITAVVLTVCVAPLAEEIQFRLVLYEALAQKLRPRSATWLTAGAFAIVHQSPVQIPALIFLGGLLQYARRRQNTLWASILLHGAFNLTNITLAGLWIFFTEST